VKRFILNDYEQGRITASSHGWDGDSHQQLLPIK